MSVADVDAMLPALRMLMIYARNTPWLCAALLPLALCCRACRHARHCAVRFQRVFYMRAFPYRVKKAKMRAACAGRGCYYRQSRHAMPLPSLRYGKEMTRLHDIRLSRDAVNYDHHVRDARMTSYASISPSPSSLQIVIPR